YEEMMKRLDLRLKIGGDTGSFEVDRVKIRPVDLNQTRKKDLGNARANTRGKEPLVIGRPPHWYMVSREWIKKAVVMDDLYVFNNPWAIQSMEKHTTYCAMMRLGLPVPDTWLIPPKEYEPKPDLQPTLERYARLFDLGDIGGQLGYPAFMKPYDGGGWAGV